MYVYVVRSDVAVKRVFYGDNNSDINVYIRELILSNKDRNLQILLTSLHKYGNSEELLFRVAKGEHMPYYQNSHIYSLPPDSGIVHNHRHLHHIIVVKVERLLAQINNSQINLIK